MKIEEPCRFVEVAGGDCSAQFTINPSAKAFHLLLDKIYTDKPLAVIREAAQNAYDANLEVGTDKPFVVTLPTPREPTLAIRDSGNGMSPAFMLNEYCSVTHSTKAATNASVGGLGIGRLSMLSMCDTYSVSTVYEGVERFYQIYLDAQRIPCIQKLGKKAAEHKGTTVSIPIEATDIGLFAKAANKALLDFSPQEVIVENGSVDHTEYWAEGEGWGLRESKISVAGYFPRVVMGPMAYDINLSLLPRAALRCKYLDLILPIGEVDVSPSREGLDYNKRTIKKLDSLFIQALEKALGYIHAYAAQGKTNATRLLREHKIRRTFVPSLGLHSLTFATWGVEPNAPLYFSVGPAYGRNTLSWSNDIDSCGLAQKLPANANDFSGVHVVRILAPLRTSNKRIHSSLSDGSNVVLLVNCQHDTDGDGWASVVAELEGATLHSNRDFDHLRTPRGAKSEAPQQKDLPPIYPYPREPNAEGLTLESLQGMADERPLYVVTSRGKRITESSMLDACEWHVWEDHLRGLGVMCIPMLVGIPVSHTKAVRWAEAHLRTPNDYLTARLARLWADPENHKRMRLTRDANDISTLDVGTLLASGTFSKAIQALPEEHKCCLAAEAHAWSSRTLNGPGNNSTYRWLTEVIAEYTQLGKLPENRSPELEKLKSLQSAMWKRYPLLPLLFDSATSMWYYNRFTQLPKAAYTHYIISIEDQA